MSIEETATATETSTSSAPVINSEKAPVAAEPKSSVDYSKFGDADDLLKGYFGEKDLADVNADGKELIEVPEMEEAALKAKVDSHPTEKEEAEAVQPETETAQDAEPEAEGIVEIIHNGQKIEVPESEALELAQKGYDYTQKTQQLAEARKTFDSELAEANGLIEQAHKDLMARESKIREEIDTKQEWDAFIDDLKTKDADLYNELANRFSEARKVYRNPIVSRQMEELKAELAQLRQATGSQQQHNAAQQFNGAFNDFIAKTEPFTKQAGIAVDWKSLAQQTGGNPAMIERAFYANYGASLKQLYESKLSLQKVTNKTQTKNVPSASSIRSKGKTIPQERVPFKKMGWNEIAQNVADGKIAYN